MAGNAKRLSPLFGQFVTVPGHQAMITANGRQGGTRTGLPAVIPRLSRMDGLAHPQIW